MDAISPEPPAPPVEHIGNQDDDVKRDCTFVNGNGVMRDQDKGEGYTDTVKELQESLEEKDEENEEEEGEEKEEEDEEEDEDTFIELPAVTKPLQSIISLNNKPQKKEEGRGRSNSLFKILGRRQKMIDEACEAGEGEVRLKYGQCLSLPCPNTQQVSTTVRKRDETISNSVLGVHHYCRTVFQPNSNSEENAF
eukprot:sb/3470998/